MSFEHDSDLSDLTSARYHNYYQRKQNKPYNQSDSCLGGNQLSNSNVFVSVVPVTMEICGV